MSPRSDHFLQSKVMMFAKDLVAPVKQERHVLLNSTLKVKSMYRVYPDVIFFILVFFLLLFLSSITEQRHLIPLQDNIMKNPMIPSCQGKTQHCC